MLNCLNVTDKTTFEDIHPSPILRLLSTHFLTEMQIVSCTWSAYLWCVTTAYVAHPTYSPFHPSFGRVQIVSNGSRLFQFSRHCSFQLLYERYCTQNHSKEPKIKFFQNSLTIWLTDQFHIKRKLFRSINIWLPFLPTIICALEKRRNKKRK